MLECICLLICLFKRHILSLPSGNLDRYVTGDAAVDILNACDDESNKSSSDGSLRPRTVFTKKLSHIATNIPKMPSQMLLRKIKAKTDVSSPSTRRKRAGLRTPGMMGRCVRFAHKYVTLIYLTC